MNKITFVLQLIFYNFFFFQVTAQNQLPIENGALENVSGNNFTQWTNLQNNGGNVNYSIETNNLISGSTKALSSEIISLGANGWDVSSKNDYAFQVVAGGEYTVSFYAKIEGATSSNLKLVFQSEQNGSFQGKDINITNSWQLYTHTFTIASTANLNQIKFWYLQSGVTYFIDEVSIVPEVSNVPYDRYVNLDVSQTFQTIEGFGAGIKRQTNKLYALDSVIRQQIEAYCFQDLEPNMIRFFIYHRLEEQGNDNDDPFVLDESQLDWRRYESDPSTTQSHYVAEALNNAFSLSVNGFDEVIGNANTAPGWMKKNNSFKRLSENEDVLLNTLKEGMLDEYSEYLTGFLKGMKSRYNIDVTAISPTNEPDYKNTYESMNLTPIELIEVTKNLNTRLDTENLSSVKIISPENGTVSPKSSSLLTPINSATNYINIILNDSEARSAIDVVATHTYFDSDHSAEWSNLKTASLGKPVWVTESASLNDSDIGMTDAANYIKWMIRGFEEGGMTAYMVHLFYEEEKENGDSSALVVWNDLGDIILPKRYHTFKHFVNLVKRGYKRIESQIDSGNDIMTSSFISPTGDKVVSQVFNEGGANTIALDVPIGTTSIQHYATSENSNTNFSLLNDISYNLGDSLVTFNATPNSLHSIVYEIQGVIDTEAPSVVSALTESNITTDSFNISWTASTDNVAVTGYNILLDGVFYGNTSNTSYPISGLLPNTTYNVSVIVLDAAGNQSTPSSLNVTTLQESSDFFIKNKATGTYLHVTDSSDGTLLKAGPLQQDDYFKWEKVAISGSNYFYYRNIGSGKYFRPLTSSEGSLLEQRPTSWNGDYTQWQEVLSADGITFHLQNKASGMYFRPTGAGTVNVDMKPTSFSGDWTRWSYEATTTSGNSSKLIASKDEKETSLLTNDVIEVYPNPIKPNENLIFDLDKYDKSLEASIYDIHGSLIFSKAIESSNISIKIDGRFSKGLYLIRFVGDDTSITKKIIVE